jgi:putative Ca2+/H+ antiporter (TMEM165/GDT1 family)
MIKEFLKSFFLILSAEMGDKTQILAMAFATQFSIKEVLTGVFLGCLLNHGIAVTLGTYLSSFIPLNVVQIAAGFTFILFGLLSLKDEDDDREEKNRKKYGPIMTVAMAFFIGELGDKTQLTAITLSVDAVFPIFVLMGTVLGMVVTSGVGIFVGSRLGNKIPEIGIKILSSLIFLAFGLVKLYYTLPQKYLTPVNISIFLIIIGTVVLTLLARRIKSHRQGKITAYEEAALTLYEYYHHIRKGIEDICLGEETCGNCSSESCIIGYTKKILDESINDENDNFKMNNVDFYNSLKKGFDKNKVINSLSMIISFLNKNLVEEERLSVVNQVRNKLEMILFNKELEFKNEEDYFNTITNIDKGISKKIIKEVRKLNLY